MSNWGLNKDKPDQTTSASSCESRAFLTKMRGLGWRKRRIDDGSARSRLHASAVYCTADPTSQIESSLAGKLAHQRPWRIKATAISKTTSIVSRLKGRRNMDPSGALVFAFFLELS
uniref:Uncharacterized protein n=1 Tax=Panagrellus redivivus TaxID=6233 RepID=A0A7E4VYP8_PANRE